MTTIHYLKPTGERVTETVPAVHLFGRYVKWAEPGMDMWITVPWERVLLIEDGGASIASALVEATVYDDMGGVVTA